MRRFMIGLGMIVTVVAGCRTTDGDTASVKQSDDLGCGFEITYQCPTGQIDGCKTGQTTVHKCVMPSNGGSTAPASAATFRLYDKPNATPDGFCDKYFELKLSPTSATMTNKLAGSCEIFVPPNPRTYTLSVKDDGCGSKVYTGKSGDRLITITDNRARLCENVIAALVVVTETTAGAARQFYSYDKDSGSSQSGTGTGGGNQGNVVPGTSCAFEILFVCPQGQIDGCVNGSTTVHKCVSTGGTAGSTGQNTFKLYDKPKATPDGFCDRYVELKFSSTSATMTNKLAGSCEIFVAPDARTYAVTAKDDGCGSTVYTGKSGANTVSITDNRHRTCENVVAASIVVSEKKAGAERKFYSLDQ